jgi:two-component system sensor histidine kinase YesM
MVAFMILSVVPLSILGAISYFNSYKTLEHNASSYAVQNTWQIKLNVDYILTNYMNKVNEITTNINFIKNVKEYNKMDRIDKSIAFQEIYNSIKNITRISNDIISVEVLDNQGLIVSTPFRISSANINQSEIFQHMINSQERIQWFSTRKLEYQDATGDSYKDNNGMGIIVSSKIKDFVNGETIGFVNIAFTEDTLYSVLEEFNSNKDQYIYIADQEGNIISHFDKKLLSQKEEYNVNSSITELESEKAGSSRFGASFVETVQEQKSLISYAISDITGWKVVSVINYDFLMADANRIKNLTLFIITVCIVFIVLVSFIVTNSVTLPIHNMIEAMNEVQHENLSVKVEDQSQDELGFLERAFNRMIDRIKKQIDEIYDANKKQKEAEFRALQAQIDPHFLYNTLDSINWMAFIAQNNDICIMINALSKFFRLSLNRGNEFYTIKDEIEHVKNYIAIQRIRYNDKINFHFDIADNVYDYMTLKLLLQPLVENAIYHGIEPSGGEGNIYIKVERLCDKIKMEVDDDGIGITNIEHACENAISRQNNGGYGIVNINERIKLYFGEKYGLEIKNRECGGTTAIIYIPAVLGGEDKK